MGALIIPDSHLHESAGNLIVGITRHAAVEMNHVRGVQVRQRDIRGLNRRPILALQQIPVHPIHANLEEHLVHRNHDRVAAHHFSHRGRAVMRIENTVYVLLHKGA